MAQQGQYKQCKMRSGNMIHTAWIPIEHAVKNHHLSIDDYPNRIFKVEEVYNTIRTDEDLNYVRRAQKTFKEKLKT